MTNKYLIQSLDCKKPKGEEGSQRQTGWIKDEKDGDECVGTEARGNYRLYCERNTLAAKPVSSSNSFDLSYTPEKFSGHLAQYWLYCIKQMPKEQ